jgi:hypothetical protein
MARYGTVHQLSDFMKRTIPSRGSGKYDELFVHQVVTFLKALDEIQEHNAWITLTVSTGGGIWVSWKGERLFLIMPAKEFLKIILRDEQRPSIRKLVKALDRAARQHMAAVAIEPTTEHDYRGWRVTAESFSVVTDFLAELKGGNDAATVTDISHPRFFPGPVRQAALEQFQRSGSRCPGVGRKPHRVDLTVERIEFDHILPYSQGGPSSALNIQVLCQECNRVKRGTALGNGA